MSEQDSRTRDVLSRRDFLKLLAAAGTALAFTPFVPWGQFMPNQCEGPAPPAFAR